MDVFAHLEVTNVFTKIFFFGRFTTGLSSSFCFFVVELSIYIIPAIFRASYISNNGILGTYLEPCQTSKIELVCKNN